MMMLMVMMLLMMMMNINNNIFLLITHVESLLQTRLNQKIACMYNSFDNECLFRTNKFTLSNKQTSK